MRARRSIWFPFWTILLVCFLILGDLFYPRIKSRQTHLIPPTTAGEWQAPPVSDLASDPNSVLIRYGKALVESTAHYLGPKGTVKQLTNGMNCQNCHLQGGTQNFANPFSATASTYPKYRDRSGQVESILFRVNDCMQRSLDGNVLDSASKEMQAMIAYIRWVGKNVPKGETPKGAGTEKLPYLPRAASVEKGKQIFESNCTRCHGANGEGVYLPDSSGYVFPPLWGQHSFNVGAGLYRLSQLAAFIKNNMPFGVTWKAPQLSAEQAWDVAAYITSQPRPVKQFPNDWPNIAKKPIDYPFGPFEDTFPERVHKYGPFHRLKKQ